jgi:uncharacterized protein (DUF3820 family)
MSNTNWITESSKLLGKLKVAEPADDKTLMTFGKWKGRKLEEVEADYLIWLLTDSDVIEKMKLYQYIVNHLPELLQEAAKTRRSKRDWEGK